jgi:hypothetical protein
MQLIPSMERDIIAISLFSLTSVKHRERTAFETYWWLTVQQGHGNAVATFQNNISCALGKYVRKIICRDPVRLCR